MKALSARSHSLFILPSTVHKTLQEKNQSETHSEISCDKVSRTDVCSQPLSTLVSARDDPELMFLHR